MRIAYTLEVARVIPDGSDAVLLSFALQAQHRQLFQFEPGQYLTIAANIGGDSHWRCYSITSEPRQPQLCVLVKRMAGGCVSNWICDNVRPGMRIEVMPPAGRFILSCPGCPALLFAGGSGIAPIFALARQALEEGAPRVSLFYANRDRLTAMLLAGLKDLQRNAPEKFSLRLWFDVQDGLPTSDALRDQALGLEDGAVYLCGPEPFMEAVKAVLEETGFDRTRIYQENFGAAVENDAGSEAGAALLLTVQVKGKEYTIAASRRETLLSAMLNAGLVVPHSCRLGECASCVCRLEQGESRAS